MHALILLTTLFTFLAAALPTTSNTAAATATVTFARNTQCAADDTPQARVAVSTACIAFPPGTRSLRVTGLADSNKLRYNSRMWFPFSFVSWCLPWEGGANEDSARVRQRRLQRRMDAGACAYVCGPGREGVYV
jgi:hypothetical protein